MFSNPTISFASLADIPALEALLNSAYRGEASKKGWTSEAHLIGGEIRTTPELLTEVMNREGSVFLKCVNEKGQLLGCVNLQKHGSRIYLSMLAVSPDMQGAGLGKALLQAAEEYALHTGCDAIYMSVVDARQELAAWYIRKGYHDTGERKLFFEDGITGKHAQQLQFMILEKRLII